VYYVAKLNLIALMTRCSMILFVAAPSVKCTPCLCAREAGRTRRPLMRGSRQQQSVVGGARGCLHTFGDYCS
jgi:hypothetical protein